MQMQLDNGDSMQYLGGGEDLWRRLSNPASAWSFFHGSIKEEFTPQRGSRKWIATAHPTTTGEKNGTF